MRKVIKIIGKLLSAIVLLLIILPVLFSLLLDIPGVQNFVVHRATAIISHALETTVSIRRVDIGLFNRVKLDGFYVEDYQRDTLLYVGHATALLSDVGFRGEGLVFEVSDVKDAKLYLKETPSGEMNIKQIVNRMSNPKRKKKGNFKMTIGDLEVENMRLRIERLEHRNPEYGVDYGDMDILIRSAGVSNFNIEGQSISADIRHFSAREKSGFDLTDLSGSFYLANGCIGFEQAQLVTPNSKITLPYIALSGDSWAQYKYFVDEVRMAGEMKNGTLSTDDIAYFSPKMKEWHTVFSRANLSVEGYVSNFKGNIRNLTVNESTSLVGSMQMRGLPDIRNTYFDLDVRRLTSSAEGADVLMKSIARKGLSDNLVRLLNNAGDIDVAARFKGRLSSFDMNLNATTKVGQVTCNLLMKPIDNNSSSLRGGVAAQNFRIGEMLGQQKLLGKVTLSGYIDGVVGKEYTDANVRGSIAHLDFKGYECDSLTLDGRLHNKGFDGRITARDKSLNFDFRGIVDLNDSIPDYDFVLDLHKADFVALNINPRDSVSVLAAKVRAKASGRSLDDLNGEIRITDVDYLYNDKQLKTANVTVRGENSHNSKFVELRSDFADATFRSKTSYHKVFEYLKQSALKYLPLLGHEEDIKSEEELSKSAVADSYSLLSVKIRHINPLADALSAGLQIADGSSLKLLFNPSSDQLSLKVSSEYVERDKFLATRLNINASNRSDSLVTYLSAEDFYAGLVHLPQLSIMGGAKQGLVQISAGFDDTTRRLSGLLGLRAGILDENGPNGRVVDLRILPSHLKRGDKAWQIFANKILLDTSRIEIDRFYVMNNEQDLLLNGVASRSRDDSVTLRLRNFNLSPFTQIAESMGYFIDGRSNGNATMKSVLHNGEFTADIVIDSLEVNDIGIPDLRLTSKWDFSRNRAGVTVSTLAKRDTVLRGFFAPATMRYYARLKVDSLDMGLLDPILSGVISSTSGTSSADLVLQGKRREADLTGEINVTDLSTTVDFTNVTYRSPRAKLYVDNNRFHSKNVTIYDMEGNRGRLDIDLNLQHLSNISYDLIVRPDRMLVLNTTAEQNDFFFGHMYASGVARIRGEKGDVSMDIAASTDYNSSFSMPLSSKSNISYADFVVFREKSDLDSLDDVTRKKIMFERRNKKKNAASSQMNISLALDVKPNVDVELSVSGDAIKARGEGTLNLLINPKSNIFEMYGDYVISEGSYIFTLQNIINKKFTIDNGSSIQWTGSPMDAMLNINAVYKLKASLQPLLQGTADNMASDRSTPVECVIHLGDRLSKPAITFDVRVPGTDPETQTLIANALSTPESVDMQFLYLLLFNSFLAENNAAATNIGASVSAATGLEFLSNQLSNWLSTSDYNLVIRYRPKSELTSDEVDFGLSKSLINNRLFVEVEGNYLIDNKQAVNSSMSNFMGEAYVTYHIDRAGALRLKAFTQTIDRFDENQGLQETGIGIYYKEDFNNFRDLRQRIRDRFTNKQRKQRREERRRRKAELRREEEQQRLEADSLRRAREMRPTPDDRPSSVPSMQGVEFVDDPK